MPEPGGKSLGDMLVEMGRTLLDSMEASARAGIDEMTADAEALADSFRGPEPRVPGNGTGVSDAWLHAAIESAVQEQAPFLTMEVSEAIADAAVKKIDVLRTPR